MVKRFLSSLQSSNVAVGPLNDSQGFKCLLLKDPWAQPQQSLAEMEAQSWGEKGSGTVVGPSDCAVANWLEKWWSPLREVIVWDCRERKSGFDRSFLLAQCLKMHIL